jgi:16S rRNA processing protein RimM
VSAAGTEGFLAVARIARPQGRRGEVAAEILTDFPERFENLRSAWLQRPGSEPEAVEVEDAWPHKGRIILKFSGVDSISDADRLRGRLVLVPQEEKVKLPSGSYFVEDLTGCRVLRKVGESTEEVGMVTEVEHTGGADLLHVAPPGDAKRVLLIPLAESICTRIDIEAKTIWIDPPEDLLELNS